MVFDIDYIDRKGNAYTLYDIDFYLKPKEVSYKNGKYVKDDTWHSDIVESTNGRWIAKFVYEQIHDEETLNEFIKDCEKIDFIRGFLHEEHRNYWLPMKEASKVKNQEHLPDIEGRIREFANKWNLRINED